MNFDKYKKLLLQNLFWKRMDHLPMEITRMILELVDCPCVTRFVCRDWRDTLPNTLPNTIMDLIPYVNLKVLVWARSNGCPWGDDPCMNAAYGNHLDILVWLRKCDVPWGATIVAGGTEIIKWALDNGCPYGEWILYDALSMDNLELIYWLTQKKFVYE